MEAPREDARFDDDPFFALDFFAADFFFVVFRAAPFFAVVFRDDELFFAPAALRGSFLRLVLASSSSCFLLIDSAICLEAPRSDDFDLPPSFADNAAPAAICCFLDFAGIKAGYERRVSSGRVNGLRAALAPPAKLHSHVGGGDLLTT